MRRQVSQPPPVEGQMLDYVIGQDRERPWLVHCELIITCRENERREIFIGDQKEDAKLKHWNTADPPNQYERWRNKAIGLLQGIRNRFIDDPTLIAEIR
jgi:hypothetical protein